MAVSRQLDRAVGDLIRQFVGSDVGNRPEYQRPAGTMPAVSQRSAQLLDAILRRNPPTQLPGHMTMPARADVIDQRMQSSIPATPPPGSPISQQDWDTMPIEHKAAITQQVAQSVSPRGPMAGGSGIGAQGGPATTTLRQAANVTQRMPQYEPNQGGMHGRGDVTGPALNRQYAAPVENNVPGTLGNEQAQVNALSSYLANDDFITPPPGSGYSQDEWNQMNDDQHRAYTTYLLQTLQDEVASGITTDTKTNENPNAPDLVPNVLEGPLHAAGKVFGKAADTVFGIPIPRPSFPTAGPGMGAGGSHQVSVGPETVGDIPGAVWNKILDFASWPKQKQDELLARVAIYEATHNGQAPPGFEWLTPPRTAPTVDPIMQQKALEAGHPVESGAAQDSSFLENTNVLFYVGRHPETWATVQQIVDNANAAHADPNKAVLNWFHMNQSGFGAIIDQIVLDPLNYLIVLGIPGTQLLRMSHAEQIAAAEERVKVYQAAIDAGKTPEQATAEAVAYVEKAGRTKAAAGTILKTVADPFSAVVERGWGRVGHVADRVMGGPGAAAERQAGQEAYDAAKGIINPGQATEEAANANRARAADESIIQMRAEKEAAVENAKAEVDKWQERVDNATTTDEKTHASRRKKNAKAKVTRAQDNLDDFNEEFGSGATTTQTSPAGTTSPATTTAPVTPTTPQAPTPIHPTLTVDSPPSDVFDEVIPENPSGGVLDAPEGLPQNVQDAYIANRDVIGDPTGNRARTELRREPIPPDAHVVTIQDYLDPETVQKYINDPTFAGADDGAQIAIKDGDTYYLMGGNHRAAAGRIANRPVDFYIVDATPAPVSAAATEAPVAAAAPVTGGTIFDDATANMARNSTADPARIEEWKRVTQPIHDAWLADDVELRAVEKARGAGRFDTPQRMAREARLQTDLEATYREIVGEEPAAYTRTYKNGKTTDAGATERFLWGNTEEATDAYQTLKQFSARPDHRWLQQHMDDLSAMRRSLGHDDLSIVTAGTPLAPVTPAVARRDTVMNDLLNEAQGLDAAPVDRVSRYTNRADRQIEEGLFHPDPEVAARARSKVYKYATDEQRAAIQAERNRLFGDQGLSAEDRAAIPKDPVQAADPELNPIVREESIKDAMAQTPAKPKRTPKAKASKPPVVEKSPDLPPRDADQAWYDAHRDYLSPYATDPSESSVGKVMRSRERDRIEGMQDEFDRRVKADGKAAANTWANNQLKTFDANLTAKERRAIIQEHFSFGYDSGFNEYGQPKNRHTGTHHGNIRDQARIFNDPGPIGIIRNPKADAEALAQQTDNVLQARTVPEKPARAPVSKDKQALNDILDEAKSYDTAPTRRTRKYKEGRASDYEKVVFGTDRQAKEAQSRLWSNPAGGGDDVTRLRAERERLFGKRATGQGGVGIAVNPKANAEILDQRVNDFLQGGRITDAPDVVIPDHIQFRAEAEEFLSKNPDLTQRQMNHLFEERDLTIRVDRKNERIRTSIWDRQQQNIKDATEGIKQPVTTDAAKLDAYQERMTKAYTEAYAKTDREFEASFKGPRRNKVVRTYQGYMSQVRQNLQFNIVTGPSRAIQDVSSNIVRSFLTGNITAVKDVLQFTWVALKHEGEDLVRATLDTDAARFVKSNGAELPGFIGERRSLERTEVALGERSPGRAGRFVDEIQFLNNNRFIRAFRGDQDWAFRTSIFFEHYNKELAGEWAKFLKYANGKTNVSSEMLSDIARLGKGANPDEIRDIIRAAGITDDSVPRAWAKAVDDLSHRANLRQQTAMLNFRKTKVDDALSKVFLFHMYTTRSSALYVKLMLQHPQLIRMEHELWRRSAENLSKFPGAPDWMKGYFGFMLNNGHALYVNPTAIASGWQLFKSIGDRGFANSEAIGILNQTGLFLNPLINAAAAMAGYEYMTDVTGLNQPMKGIMAIANMVLDSEWIKDHPTLRKQLEHVRTNQLMQVENEFVAWINEEAGKHFSAIKDFSFKDQSQVRKDGIQATLTTNFVEEYGADQESWPKAVKDRYAAAQAALETGDPNPDLDDAISEYDHVQAASVVVNAVLPTGGSVRDAQNDARLNEAYTAGQTPKADRTAEQQGAVDTQTLDKIVDPNARALQQAVNDYGAIGTDRQQELQAGYNAIVYNVDITDRSDPRYMPDDWVIDIGGRQYTVAQVRAMDQDKRKDLANTWTAETSIPGGKARNPADQTNEYGEYQSQRKAMRDATPTLAAFNTYKGWISDQIDGGTFDQQVQSMLAVGDTEFSRAYHRQEDYLDSLGLTALEKASRLQSWMTSPEAYAAIQGWQWMGNDKPGPALFNARTPAPWLSAPTSGTGKGATTSTPKDTSLPGLLATAGDYYGGQATSGYKKLQKRQLGIPVSGDSSSPYGYVPEILSKYLLR